MLNTTRYYLPLWLTVVFLLLSTACSPNNPISTPTVYSLKPTKPATPTLALTNTLTPTIIPTPTPEPAARLQDIEIVNDTFHPEKFPQVNWEDVISGALVEVLREKYDRGELGKISDKAKPFIPVIYPEKDFHPYIIASTAIDLGSFSLQSGIYLDSDVKPYIIIPAFFVTDIGGEKHILSYSIWRNLNQKRDSFLPYLYDYDMVAENINDFQEFFNKEIDPTYMFFPGKFFNKDDCKEYGFSLLYCDWYFEQKSTINSLMDEWAKTGDIPEELENFPVWGQRTHAVLH